MGLRTRRALALAASAMFVAAACGGTATSTPTGTPAATSTPAPTTQRAGRVAVGLAVSRSTRQLFGTNYAPKTPSSTAPNGTLLMGEWQPEDTLNVWFSTSYSAVEATQPADARLRRHHLGRQVHPRPGDDRADRLRTAAS